jgi:SAM-dependent methyltransferase
MSSSDRLPASPVSHIREHIEIIEGDLAIVRHDMAGARRILDVGAGPATFVRIARRAGYDALALDIEPGARAIWSSGHIPGVLADGFRLPIRDGVFDVVRIKEVIEHVEDPRRLLLASRSALTREGFVIAHVPSPYSQFYPVANFWDDYTHVRPLTRSGLERLFIDAGFRVMRIQGYVAGRNAIERVAGALLGRFVPHTYRIVATTER